MMNADNWLGGIVYGYDSQFNLGNSTVSEYRNPFVEQAHQITSPAEYTRSFFNLQYGLRPQFFLKIAGASLARLQPDLLALQSTEITLASGVLDDGGNSRIIGGCNLERDAESDAAGGRNAWK